MTNTDTTDDVIDAEQVIESIKANGGTIWQNQEVVADIVRLHNRWIEQAKRPLYIYCIVSGDKCAMTAVALFDKRLEQYGSLFGLLVQYRGRGARETRTVERLTASGTKIRVAKRTSASAVDPAREAAAALPVEQWIKLPPAMWPIWSEPTTSINARHILETNRVQLHTKPTGTSIALAIDITRTTCIRPDISMSKAGCFGCIYALICRASCRQFRLLSGRMTSEWTREVRLAVMETKGLVMPPYDDPQVEVAA